MKIFNQIDTARFEELLSRFGEVRVAVVGDFFLDLYLDVDPTLAERSLETGKIAHQVVGLRHSPGAAGTVMNNLAALGAGELWAVGFVGDDCYGYQLRRDLQALGCNTECLFIEPSRFTPTYCKPRDKADLTLAGEHNRYDIKNRKPLPAETEQKIIEALVRFLEQGINAVVVSDQVEEENCGVITDRVRDVLSQLARQYTDVVFWVDSRRRIRRFRNVIVKPNQFEAVGWESPPPDAEVPIEELGRAVFILRQQNGAPVVATCGSRGMLVSDPELTVVPAVTVTGPIDPTGAGDSATAAAVLALGAGATLPEAALAGNLAASVTITQLATTGTATREQLRFQLRLWQQQQARN